MSRHKVLIVEDEHDIAGLIKHTLERGGDIDPYVVGSGDAALKHVAEEPPDLIILDLNLPVVSGVEVCRILRARASARCCGAASQKTIARWRCIAEIISSPTSTPCPSR